MSTKGKNEYAYNNFDLLTKLFYPFFNAAINKEPNDIIDENEYKDVIEDYLEKSKRNLEYLEDIKDSIQKFEKQKYEYSEKGNKLYDEFIKTRDKDTKAQMDSMHNKFSYVIDRIEKYQSQKKITEREIEQQKYKATVKLVKRIMSITGFVALWQLSNKAKKKIDVNQVSLVKIFFQKLTELIKNTGAKYIIAQGKDEHVTRAYIKLGGFNSTEEFYNKYAAQLNHYRKSDLEFLEGTVIKRI